MENALTGKARQAREDEAIRQQQELLKVAQFARRKAKGALTEIREALLSLDTMVEHMVDRFPK